MRRISPFCISERRTWVCTDNTEVLNSFGLYLVILLRMLGKVLFNACYQDRDSYHFELYKLEFMEIHHYFTFNTNFKKSLVLYSPRRPYTERETQQTYTYFVVKARSHSAIVEAGTSDASSGYARGVHGHSQPQRQDSRGGISRFMLAYLYYC